MVDDTERRSLSWRSAAAIAGLLLLGSLVTAQDPVPPPAPVQPPDAQDQQTKTSRIEELEARVKAVDEEIRAKELEWVEADEQFRQRRDEVEQNDTLEQYLFAVTGHGYQLTGARFEDDESPGRTERRRRDRIDDQIWKLRWTRDELNGQLSAARYGSLTSFVDDATMNAARGGGIYDLEGRPKVDPTPTPAPPGRASAPQRTPTPAAADTRRPPAVQPTATPSSEPRSGDMSSNPSLRSGWNVSAPTVAWYPAMGPRASLNATDAGANPTFQVFTRTSLDQTGRVWWEYRPSVNLQPLGGLGKVEPLGGGRFFLNGSAGDGSAAVIGEFQVSAGDFSEEFGRGTSQIKLVTPEGTNEFHGSTFYAFRGKTLNANSFFFDATGNIDKDTVPREPSLILTTGRGGPVIRGNQFFFFDAKGAKVGEGSGVWGYNNGSRLTYTSEAASHHLRLDLDYRADRATGTLTPGSGFMAGPTPETVRIDAADLLPRTPFFLFELEEQYGQPSDPPVEPSVWDNMRIERAVGNMASAYGVPGGALRPAPTPVPEMSDWTSFNPRLGFGIYSWNDTSNPLSSGPYFLSGDHLNSSDFMMLSPDSKTQLGGARLLLLGSGRAREVIPLLARRAGEAVRASLVRWSPDPAPMRTSASAALAQRRGGGSAAPAVYFRSLGKSTGPDAIEMTYVGSAPLPASTDNLLVLEPIAPQDGKRIEKQIAQASRGRAVVMKLAMYCLNQRLLTPAPGQIMRLAGTAAHNKFVHVLPIWDAADRARNEGTLRPDSDPADYYHSIVQWAIWTKEQGFDERSFGDAFAQHTRKNLESAGHTWSPQVEGVVRGIVPNRWNDVQRVLKAAGL